MSSLPDPDAGRFPPPPTGESRDNGAGSPGPLDAVAELAVRMLGAHDHSVFLTDLVASAVDAVGAAAVAGLTVRPITGGSVRRAHSDELARRMDAAQHEAGEGPLLACLSEVAEVGVDDLATDPRWPLFTRTGLQNGVGSALTLPLLAAGRPVGALTWYTRRPRGLRDRRHEAHRFARRTGALVAFAARLTDLEEENRQLNAKLASAPTIEQAKGILMASGGLTADEAFAVLRLRSQQTNTKLREVALTVVRQFDRAGG